MEISPQSLPNWMRQSRRGVDWGVLLVLVLSAAAAWGLLLQPSLPRTNASEHYVFRTTDYTAALSEGRLYPRWSPNVFSGYGAPIPHYFPPGTPYFTALLDIFFTSDPVAAVSLAFSASLVLSGAMVYVFVMRRAGASAGVLSALLYVYSPFVGSTTPYILGDLPAALALALLPALLWSVNRLLSLNRSQDFTWVVLVSAGLLLTEVRYAVAGMALSLLLMLLGNFNNTPRKRILFVLFGLITGVLLASVYWLPVLLEWNAVYWQRPALPGPLLSVQPMDLLHPLQQVDLGELIPQPQWSLGIPGLLFLIASGFSVIVYGQKVVFQAAFFVMGILLLIIMLIFPTEIWMLGPATLCLSVGGSAALEFSRRLNSVRRRLTLPIVILIVLVTALPVWLVPNWSADFGDTSPEAQIDYERRGYGNAVVPAGVSIPATISVDLPPNRYLLDSYRIGIINKITPDQFTVSVLQHNTHSDRVQLSSNTPQVLYVLTAYFPGWVARVNGVNTALEPDPETGLIRVILSDTRVSELLIVLDPTPPRTGGWIISWTALGIVLLIGWRRGRRQGELYDDVELLMTAEARLAAIVAGGFILAILIFATPSSPLSLRQRPGHGLEGSIALRSGTGAGLEAFAYRLDDTQYQPGDTIQLEMYWRSLRFLSENYKVRAYLVRLGGDSVRWFETELRHPGGYPTRRWISNRYVSDFYVFQLSEGVPTGNYQIALELYNCEIFCIPESRLTFFDSSGNPTGQVLLLPPIISIRP